MNYTCDTYGCGNIKRNNNSGICQDCSTRCECGNSKSRSSTVCYQCKLKCECGRLKSAAERDYCSYCLKNSPDIYCDECCKKLGTRKALAGKKFCSAVCNMKSLSNINDRFDGDNNQEHIKAITEGDQTLPETNGDIVGAKSLMTVIIDLWQFLEDNSEQLERFPDACVYCGDWAVVHDHLLPRNFTGEIYRSAVPTVQACSRCNGILSDVFLMNISERATYVARAERRKNKKMLDSIEWSLEALEDLGRGLKGSITQYHRDKMHLIGRLTILDIGGILYLGES